MNAHHVSARHMSSYLHLPVVRVRERCQRLHAAGLHQALRQADLAAQIGQRCRSRPLQLSISRGLATRVCCIGKQKPSKTITASAVTEHIMPTCYIDDPGLL